MIKNEKEYSSKLKNVLKPSSKGDIVLKCSNVVKTYPSGDEHLIVLDELNVEFKVGQFTGILGVSGSGKTTLIHAIAGLIPIDSGEISFLGSSILEFTPNQMSSYRAKDIGLIFQFFELHESLSAADNVGLPMLIAGKTREDRIQHSMELLKLVDLEETRFNLLPHELSGGEQQRVAIARSIANSPRLLLADEPTGDLDSQAGVKIMELLADISREQWMSVVVVTHDQTLLPKNTRIMTLEKGKLLPGMRITGFENNIERNE